MAHRLPLLTLLTLSGSLVALSSPHETYSASIGSGTAGSGTALAASDPSSRVSRLKSSPTTVTSLARRWR